MKYEVKKTIRKAKRSFRHALASGVLFAAMLPVLLVFGLTQGDQVYLALNATETTETLVGTITVPTAGVSRIVGIYGVLMQPVQTSGETISGYFRLAFTTVSGKFKFPVQAAGGMVTSANWNSVDPKIIPVNIPVPPNEQISCYMAANKALTGTGEGMVGVIFE